MSKFKIGDQVNFNGEGTIHQLYFDCDNAVTDLVNCNDYRGMDIFIDDIIMFVPILTGITIEKVTPTYEWQDGDAIQSRKGNIAFNRNDGKWDSTNYHDRHRYTDKDITYLVESNDCRILRYQEGGINE